MLDEYSCNKLLNKQKYRKKFIEYLLKREKLSHSLKYEISFHANCNQLYLLASKHELDSDTIRRCIVFGNGKVCSKILERYDFYVLTSYQKMLLYDNNLKLRKKMKKLGYIRFERKKND